jgi:probable phosphoglycerate mutase
MIPLLVIRHGATDWNDARRIQGRTDRPLSEAARRELNNVRLPAEWGQARCLASPLRRCMETATGLGLTAQPEARLTEMAWGAWEGRRLSELREELGDAMRENEKRGLDFRPPGGESPRDVQARLRPLLAGLTERTVFVTHKGVLRALYALATGWTMQEKPPQKLVDGHAHAFTVARDGTLVVLELNIPLEPR